MKCKKFYICLYSVNLFNYCSCKICNSQYLLVLSELSPLKVTAYIYFIILMQITWLGSSFRTRLLIALMHFRLVLMIMSFHISHDRYQVNTAKESARCNRWMFQSTLLEELCMKTFATGYILCKMATSCLERQKINRLIHAKRLLSMAKHQGPWMLCFFSDERKIESEPKGQSKEGHTVMKKS